MKLNNCFVCVSNHDVLKYFKSLKNATFILSHGTHYLISCKENTVKQVREKLLTNSNLQKIYFCPVFNVA